MNLSKDCINKCFTRNRNLPKQYSKLHGKVMRVIKFTDKEIHLCIQNGWYDTNQIVTLPIEFATDNGWYDVDHLILDASTHILPHDTDCQFKSKVATAYSEHLTNISDYKLSFQNSLNKFVFRGKQDDEGNVQLHKTPYYVAACDEDGYGLAYYDVDNGGEDIRLVKFNSPDISFYDAVTIAKVCNDKASKDVQSKNKHISNFVNSGKITKRTPIPQYSTDGVRKLNIV